MLDTALALSLLTAPPIGLAVAAIRVSERRSTHRAGDLVMKGGLVIVACATTVAILGYPAIVGATIMSGPTMANTTLRLAITLAVGWGTIGLTSILIGATIRQKNESNH